jgi:hypothetical protein
VGAPLWANGPLTPATSGTETGASCGVGAIVGVIDAPRSPSALRVATDYPYCFKISIALPICGANSLARVGSPNTAPTKRCTVVAVVNKPQGTKEWPRIVSGLEVIRWSTLVSWDELGLRLVAAADRDTFNAHWPRIDPRFGRWLCWVAFAVGAESIVRGAFDVLGHPIKRFGAADNPWNLILGTNAQTEVDSIKHLARVRNRDAHEYVPEVRDISFPDVETLYVPALNRVLDSLGDENLRSHLATHY